MVSARRHRIEQSACRQFHSNTNSALYTEPDLVPGITTRLRHGRIYQIGVGYQFNHWLRADITGEYRGKSNFHGSHLTSFPLGGLRRFWLRHLQCAASPKWLFLANAYVDLGTWWCITPYIGAGIGTCAGNRSANFTDDRHVAAQRRWRRARAWFRRMTARSGISPGRCMRVSPTRSTRTWRSNLATATSISATARRESTAPLITRPAATSFQFHNITSQRSETRRALESRQPAGLCAAARHQGLIERI